MTRTRGRSRAGPGGGSDGPVGRRHRGAGGRAAGSSRTAPGPDADRDRTRCRARPPATPRRPTLEDTYPFLSTHCRPAARRLRRGGVHHRRPGRRLRPHRRAAGRGRGLRDARRSYGARPGTGSSTARPSSSGRTSAPATTSTPCGAPSRSCGRATPGSASRPSGWALISCGAGARRAYGDLDVTGGGRFSADQLSYDIFAQAAQALRRPAGTDPMGPLHVENVLGVGASQSAGRMTVYYDAVLPQVEAVFDGYGFIVGSAPRRQGREPVFQVLSETDVRTPDRPADTDRFRRWEVAGAAHSGWHGSAYRQPIVERDLGAAAAVRLQHAPAQPGAAAPRRGGGLRPPRPLGRDGHPAARPRSRWRSTPTAPRPATSTGSRSVVSGCRRSRCPRR